MGSKLRRLGKKVLLLVCGVLLLAAGFWIRMKTWGIRMLYVHTLLGKYYWICYVLCLLGLICIVAGLLVGRIKKDETVSEAEAVSEETAVPEIEETILLEEKTVSEEMIVPEETPEVQEVICPHCQTRLPAGAVFCKNCGKRIKDEENA